MDREQAYRDVVGRPEDLISNTFATQTGSYADRPNEVVWCEQRRRRRVRIVQCHWQEQKRVVGRHAHPRSGFLATPVRSPFPRP